MTIDDLLTRLGWSTRHLDKKGMLQWRAGEISAELVVTPKTIRAALLKQSADMLKPDEPYYQVVWDITSGTPVRVVHVFFGENVPTTVTDEQAIFGFTSLVLAIPRPPKLEIMGTRVKG